MRKPTVAFALESYLPRTFTWVYNQLKFLKNTHILILAGMLDPERIQFPLSGQELFSFPGLEVVKTSGILMRLFRRFLRLLLTGSRLDRLVFAWKARRYGCSLIHAHFGHMGWKFILVAKMLGVPLVVSFYGFDYNRLPNTQPKWKKRYRVLFQYGSLFLTEGEYGRAALIKKGVSPGRVKAYHLGVDADTIPFKVRFLAQGEILRLVQVAGFVEKKGHRILIEAMRLLRDKGLVGRMSLTFIGDGPLKQGIIGLTQKYHLTEYITFIGHLPYENLHQELLQYHVFIHPSLTTLAGDCEGGAPVVLLDAQATGMPVISTLHCDIPEEVVDRETGILVPEGDHKALAEAIARFLNEPKLLSEYGTAGRLHIEKNYSASRQAEKLEIIYSGLIGNQSGVDS